MNFIPRSISKEKSSSGIHSGPRRIGLKIGVSAFKDGDLPPPPPKSKPKGRHHRSTTRKIRPIAPMSKIAETDGSVTTEGESNELKSSTSSRKSSWKPIPVSPVLNERKEPHPFLVSSGAGTARRAARHSSYNNRISRRVSKSSRNVNRSRSTPNILKNNNSDSGSSESLQEEEITSKALSESNSTPSHSKEKSSKAKSKPKSLSPCRSIDHTGMIQNEMPLGRTTPTQRVVGRNKSLPMTSKHSNSSVSTTSFVDDYDDTTKTSSEGPLSPSITEGPSRRVDAKDNTNVFSAKKKRGKSVPRMRLVPVTPTKNKSNDSSNSSPSTLIRSDQNKPRQRGRSLSKYKTSLKESDKSRSSEQKPLLSKSNQNSDTISDEGSEGMTSDSSNTKSESSESASSNLDKSNRRQSVMRRWKPPSNSDDAIPPAFRSSSQRFKLSGSSHSGKSMKSNNSRDSTIGSKSDEPKESRSEEEKDDISSSSDESDYVRSTVRKPAKVVNRPDPQQFKQYMTELTQVIQSDTSRPDDYLPGSGSPFAATRKKKLQYIKKRFENGSELRKPRSEEWIGSGKAQKRSWKVKKTVEC